MRRVGLSAVFAAIVSVTLLASPPAAQADPAVAAREAANAALAAAAPGAPAETAKPADVDAPAEVLRPAAPPSTTPEAAAIAAAPADAPAEVKKAPPPVTLAVDIDLTKQRMVVSEDGKAKYTWAISSGRSGYETPTGRFRPGWMAKMWYSKQYDDAPMPHAVFFNGGIAVHATSSTGMLGRPASHGCIRLAPANAATFYKLVQKHSMAGTRIAVHGKAKQSAPAVASRRDPGTLAGGYPSPYAPRVGYGRPLPGSYAYYPPAPYGYVQQPRRQQRRVYTYNDPYGYTPYRGPVQYVRPYGYGGYGGYRPY